ncbi:MAG: nicotinamide-nucleotide amidohydrolase family protein [bacterium]|nr:nicotinamide-nucleotide amidohydrolase family protein [bacterium]
MSRAESAACLAIGDELLAGAHPDLNSPFLAARLPEWGRHVVRIAEVRDDERAIAEAVTELAREAGLVLVSGGLGPTLDDVTRHGVARAAGLELEHSEEAWEQSSAWYRQGGREVPESNRRQALIPRGAEVLHNGHGTAPGFHVRVGGANCFALPGPPHELQGMFADVVEPWLARNPVGELVYDVRRMHLYDLSESVFADSVGNWMARGVNPLMGVTVKGGILSVRLIAHGVSASEAAERNARRAGELAGLFGERVFSETTADLAYAVGELLIERGVQTTCAESCTGGLVASRLTSVPGISAVFREGFVTYSDEAKSRRLGVPEPLLAAHGAVSAPVAAAMASGAAEAAGADLAVSLTGVAGPDGGTPDKPVGLVWFGIAHRGEVSTHERRWPNAGRARVREWAASKALSLLLAAVRETPSGA